MMVIDETPPSAAPREVQRPLLVLGVLVVLLAMFMTVIAAQVARPHLDFGPLQTAALFVLPALLHLGSVQLAYLHAATAQQSTRQAGRRALHTVAAFFFGLNGLLMLTAGIGIGGSLVAGVFGALGPFFLAELLDEKAGVWLARKDNRPAASHPIR